MLGIWLAAFSLAIAIPAKAQEMIGGTKPTYLAKSLSTVPNAQAIVKRIWAPGLDDGYTPQGLTNIGTKLYMAGYGRGCVVFGISEEGEAQSQTPVPACSHGGGLASIGGGRLVVIDTRSLHMVEGAVATRSLPLATPLRGSFGDFDGTALWIGSYNKDGGRAWRFPLSTLEKPSLAEADATASFALPAYAQGMAFFRGDMWVTASTSRFGKLYRLNTVTGAVIAAYDMPAGIEDIAASGHLIWAVSEAGAQQYTGWDTNFPLIFAIDPAKLR